MNRDVRRPYQRRQSQAALVEKYRMIGQSEAFLDCMEQVSRAARVNRPVLIIGERGTGKELVAARLHYLSPRWQQPRITLNCAAFSPELLESELFGYEQGAFTGAIRAKPGRFELAAGGGIFLDELANSPRALQEKILRVIEYGEFERVGGVETIEVDTRVVAATNQDLPYLCRQGKFKEDLLDRLSFDVITLPPLRARKEDIAPLTQAFAMRMAHELELEEPPEMTQTAWESLLDYDWPGNVRELKNVVERAVYKCEGEPIAVIEFDPFLSPYRPAMTASAVASANTEKGAPAENAKVMPPPNPASGQGGMDTGSLPEAIEAVERQRVSAALKKTHFNQKKAAERLGISYYQLRRIMKRLDLP